MIVDDAATVTRLATTNPVPWDQMSHYVWLTADRVERAEAKAAFRAAWHQWSIVNAVLVQASGAYTYDPFRDALALRAVDADTLRTVARHKMRDLNGYPVSVLRHRH